MFNVYKDLRSVAWVTSLCHDTVESFFEHLQPNLKDLYPKVTHWEWASWYVLGSWGGWTVGYCQCSNRSIPSLRHMNQEVHPTSFRSSVRLHVTGVLWARLSTIVLRSYGNIGWTLHKGHFFTLFSAKKHLFACTSNGTYISLLAVANKFIYNKMDLQWNDLFLTKLQSSISNHTIFTNELR